jgi:hypothetical protein
MGKTVIHILFRKRKEEKMESKMDFDPNLGIMQLY